MDKLKEARNEVKEAELRLLDVIIRGDVAISEYDLKFGYNAKFYLGDNEDGMLYHHVSYAKKKLDELLKNGEQLTMF